MRTLALLVLLASACNGRRENGTPDTPAVTVGGRTWKLEIVATRAGRKSLPDRSYSNAVLVYQGHARFHHYEIPRALDFLFLDDEGRILEVVTQDPPREGGVTSSVECRRALLLPSGSGAKAGQSVALPQLKVTGEPEAEIRVNSFAVNVEFARTWEERQHGLMWRPRLSKDDGMLFVYDHPDMRRFWMGNTLLDLDIAFFREDRTLINVVEMRKYPDPSVDTGDRAASLEPAKYVLEVNHGWFRAHGLADATGRPVGTVQFEPPP